MFDTLSERPFRAPGVAGKATLSEDNIKDTLREVRQALLEADVALPVVKDFIDQVRERAVGQEVMKSLSPGQAFLRIVQLELERAMGTANETLDLATTPPAVILMAGLQGSGKTTSAAKLARWSEGQKGKKVLMVSADVYRPAAIRQLETLAESVGVGFSRAEPRGTAPAGHRARRAADGAHPVFPDVLIVDTAGRLAIDAEMMQEIRDLHAAVKPIETLFVVDAMTGQDAAQTARAFNEALPLTGVILSKADADSRGGAALSVRGSPASRSSSSASARRPMPGAVLPGPDRLAHPRHGRHPVADRGGRAQARPRQGREAGEEDQEGQGLRSRGLPRSCSRCATWAASAHARQAPGMGGLAQMAQQKVDSEMFARMEAIINSMTPRERRDPDMLKARASGASPRARAPRSRT